MQVITVILTKGSVVANLGAFITDAGLRVMLLDLDMRPTLPSYYELKHRPPEGIYELLASQQAVSHVTSEILAARERRRGTLRLLQDVSTYRKQGIEPPPLHLLINRVPALSSNARLIQKTLRLIFQEQPSVYVLGTEIPAIEALPCTTTRSLPSHRVKHRRPSRNQALATQEIVHSQANKLCPQRREQSVRVTGKSTRRFSHVERT